MKKRILSLLTAFALCLSLVCIPAFAAGAEVSGVYDAGVVTVTGTGFIPNMKYSLISIHSGNELVTFDGATADPDGGLSVAMDTGTIADLTGYTVTVYEDATGNPVATGNITEKVIGHSVTITVKKDGAAWSGGAAPTIQLEASNGTKSSNGSTLADGSYKILANDVDTGKTVTVNGSTVTQPLDYYTVTYTATPAGTASGADASATYDSKPISSGAVVLGGKALAITASGSGASSYTYAWDGASQTASQTLTIPALSTKVDVTCTVTGSGSIAATPSFEASTMTLSGVSTGMSYSIDGGSTWVSISGSTADLSNAGVTAANGIQVKDGSTVTPITLTQAARPTGVGKTNETSSNAQNGTLTGVSSSMEYRLFTASAWMSCPGSTVTNLAPGTYLVRVKGHGTVLASETVSLTISAYSSGGSGGGGGGGGSSSSSPVTVRSHSNGKVAVSPANASKGSKVTLTVTPDSGYELSGLVVKDSDGNEIDVTRVSDTKYTFTMPSGKVTITPTFAKAESTEPSTPAISFHDVASSAYYYDAVRWAVEQGITNGTGTDTFSPNTSCTRAQMVTFLWRAAGSPTTYTSNPFADVASGAYYYDAMLWAVANGITSGTGTDTFSPDAIVSRAQTVTFLYRYAGSPSTVSDNPFVDVDANAYYGAAVRWAVEQGITSGTGADTFSPASDCTRAQIVTFLYRDLA